MKGLLRQPNGVRGDALALRTGLTTGVRFPGVPGGPGDQAVHARVYPGWDPRSRATLCPALCCARCCPPGGPLDHTGASSPGAATSATRVTQRRCHSLRDWSEGRTSSPPALNQRECSGNSSCEVRLRRRATSASRRISLSPAGVRSDDRRVARTIETLPCTRGPPGWNCRTWLSRATQRRRHGTELSKEMATVGYGWRVSMKSRKTTCASDEFLRLHSTSLARCRRRLPPMLRCKGLSIPIRRRQR